MTRKDLTDREVDLKEVLIWSEQYLSREYVRTRLIGVERSHWSVAVSYLPVVEGHQVMAEKNCSLTAEDYSTRSVQIPVYDLFLFGQETFLVNSSSNVWTIIPNLELSLLLVVASQLHI